MPEHVHLLVNEPERGTLAQAMQSLKQGVARRLALRAADPFWEARYYDFNVWSEKKFVEKLRYIHRNPVQRGLVARPEDWRWSSFRHYATSERGVVEIESQWTARRRERVGIVSHGADALSLAKPPPKRSLDGAPSECQMRVGGFGAHRQNGLSSKNNPQLLFKSGAADSVPALLPNS